MSRLLFTLWDGGGNAPPVLGLAGTFVSRGHEVTVLADDSLGAAVTGSGARHIAWTRAPQRATPDPETEFIRDFEPGTPFGASARVRDRLIVDPAADFAEDTLEAYASNYVHQEIQQEALTKDLAGFARFLRVTGRSPDLVRTDLAEAEVRRKARCPIRIRPVGHEHDLPLCLAAQAGERLEDAGDRKSVV